MADTLTTNTQLTNQTEGGNNNTWGTIADANFELIDNLFGDTTAISTTGGTTALTTNQELVANLSLSGALVSNATVTFSGRGGFWIIYNNTSGSFTVTAKVTGQTGVAIPQGTSKVIWCNGTDILLGSTEASASVEATVASATTTNIAGADSTFIAISGTATITSLGTGATRYRFVRATGAFTLTHNASSLICPGGADILVASGDTFVVVFDASSNARIYGYQRSAFPPPIVPPGGIMDYGGTSAPAGWLLCYGQAVSRTTYAALFAAISTTFGVGNGATTFNLPDCRGRVVAGKDDMGGSSANRLTNQTGGLDGDGLGNTGGAETHQITLAQSAAHTHTTPYTLANYSAPGGAPAVSSVIAGASTTTTSSAGSDTAHNNVQPTIIFNKIIFAGV